jgi:hypothetical protein
MHSTFSVSKVGGGSALMGEEAHAAIALQPVFAELSTVPVRMQPVLKYSMRKAALVAKLTTALAEVGARDPCGDLPWASAQLTLASLQSNEQRRLCSATQGRGIGALVLSLRKRSALIYPSTRVVRLVGDEKKRT